MAGRSDKQLNRTDTRRARAELTTRVEGLAQKILDHIASNPHPPARAVRGRTPSRPSTGQRRSVSFSTVCGCPGTVCSSVPGASHPPAYTVLDPSAPSFTPARSGSRNTARRSRVQGSSSTLCRPRLNLPIPGAQAIKILLFWSSHPSSATRPFCYFRRGPR